MLQSVSRSEQKLNTLRALNSQQFNKVRSSSVSGKTEHESAVNDYIMRCVSLLMEVPLKQIRNSSRKADACNARMVCYYVLKMQTGYSYRQIASLYDSNVSMVHRTIKRMEFYYSHQYYPQLNMVADLVNQAVKEKLLVFYYERNNEL
jgi:chromosomal replication initiation ATPase DnaA